MTPEDVESCECAGCGGDVSVVEAVWLPAPTNRILTQADYDKAKSYCSVKCFETNSHPRTPMTPEERAGFIVAPYVAIVDAPAALGELIAEHIRQAVAEEREACAKVCDGTIDKYGTLHHLTPWACAQAIRNRK